MKQVHTILAIESSCDDTSIALVDKGLLKANAVASQEVHKSYGGVVPELASRAHTSHIVPLVAETLRINNMKMNDLDAIVATRGPGLLGSLFVGWEFAKGLSIALDVPLLGVHHMMAHALSPMGADQPATFPYLCLNVSGGHTQFVMVRDWHEVEVLGGTLDDAVGEAFDKSAKMLGLPYPGGPFMDKMSKEGNPLKYTFSRPKTEGLDFSFSGVKTAIRYFLEKETKHNPTFIKDNLHDLCASIQHTLVAILLDKYRHAVDLYDLPCIALAGGVSANSALRSAIQEFAQSHKIKVALPPISLCTDNAGMVGLLGYHLLKKGYQTHLDKTPLARWDLHEWDAL
ncbi:MAG: tRNA (adenosine(37)-N6)-threonylcarbamoyltransferase complex transferase subunit TsaD [Chitinophagales bacterium]